MADIVRKGKLKMAKKSQLRHLITLKPYNYKCHKLFWFDNSTHSMFVPSFEESEKGAHFAC